MNVATSYKPGEIVMLRNGFHEWCYGVITRVEGCKWHATALLSPREAACHRAGQSIPQAPDRSFLDPDLGSFEIERRPTAAEIAAAPHAVLKLQQEVQ